MRKKNIKQINKIQENSFYTTDTRMCDLTQKE